MPKKKEAKRLCRCGCGKMLSARAERRHREGKVPPRIAAVHWQKPQKKVSSGIPHLSQLIKTVATTSEASATRADEDFNWVPSPMSVFSDNEPILPEFPEPEDNIMMTTANNNEPVTTATVNTSVEKARAAVWSEWRAQRENEDVSDDEEDNNINPEDSSHKNSDDEQVGLVDAEDDGDSEDECNSVDDQIEAEWEKQWAEMGALNFYVDVFSTLILLIDRKSVV